ncbi:hypothetical protein [Novosphingobium huizhouense]|uniref:hypothetical protein n=1 Tax=Novosphingobium huizhouense TaxID=2866625 RepID=UPI001CD82761|nr:hypothetical protein [Novosphingobium huizhouense]
MPRTRSRGELVAVSSLAVATALASGVIVAHAQSFQGNGEVVAGSASIFATGSTTTVTVNSANAVINWNPYDDASGGGPIAFQPQGTTTTFTNNFDTTADFAVLNRILPADPSRQVQFDGTVISQLQTASGTTRGGTVFFYSPGGILIGSNAVFDVGNLGLSASDIPFDQSTGAFSTNGVVTFQQADAGATIEIASGAQISVGAPGPDTNSYLAIVAPKITQSGTIDVNGSAALVAADAATIEFSPSSLFSIRVDQGTSATGTVLQHNGSIGGAAGSSTAFIHRIYMVAVPRNDAITMAIAGGSSLGFDVAGAADVVGNTVVLSAGYDVVGGSASFERSAGGGTGASEITIGAIAASSAVDAKSTGATTLSIAGGATGAFASDVTLRGAALPGADPGFGAQVVVDGADSSLDVQGNLSLVSLDSAVVGLGGVNDTSLAAVTVSAGSLTVGQRLSIRADRTGAVDTALTTGGTASLTASDGAFVGVGEGIDLGASGLGGSASSAATAGSGKGGVAQIVYGTGAQIEAQYIDVFAEGIGGNVSGGYGGGGGQGGFASIIAGEGGGSLTVSDHVSIGASGTGTYGEGCATCTIEGGTGIGGNAGFVLSGSAAHTVNIAGDLTITANGFGGNSYSGVAGNATGGVAGLTATGAHTVGIAGTTFVNADASGGSQSFVSRSGSALGGVAQVKVDGATLTLGDLDVSATAEGGADYLGGQGGAATGGTALVQVLSSGSSLTADDVRVATYAEGGGSGEGQAGAGGDGLGGTSSVDAFAGQISMASLRAEAGGYGGNGATSGGSGTGGFAALRTSGGAISISGLASVLADGSGSIAEYGGSGTGGHALISATGGSLDFSPDGGEVTVRARGQGGTGYFKAGSGTGGLAEAIASNGTIRFDGGLALEAEGLGGRGSIDSDGSGGGGGAGKGGSVTLDARSDLGGASTITGTDFRLSAYGRGGDGSDGEGVSVPSGILTPGNGGLGADGTGGSVRVNAGAGNGNLTPRSLTIDASGEGGLGGSGGDNDSSTGPAGGAGGTGGAGFGGTVLLDTEGALAGVASTGSLAAGSLVVNATGTGGQGGSGGFGPTRGPAAAGGAGTGGAITVRADRGGSVIRVDGETNLLVTGFGAQGVGCASCSHDGGMGLGGTILFTADGTTTGNRLMFASVFTDAGGVGGASLTTSGGNGRGGSVRIEAGSGLDIFADLLTLRAPGFGGTAQGTNVGGAGNGGTVNVAVHAGATLNGNMSIDVGATGGNNTDQGGIGGFALGGQAYLRSIGGAITLGDVVVGATAFGGAGDQSGGTGIGGSAEGGFASLTAGNDDELGNGGSIVALGQATVTTYASGGEGTNGGSATSGTAGIYARNGSVDLASVTVDSRALGGAGRDGGVGGSATAGAAIISSQSDLAGSAKITIGSATVLAQSFGGTGGTARNGTGVDGIGGRGGDGLGGSVAVLGSAGNGALIIDTAVLSAQGAGGVGGNGGDNDSTAGGLGGRGGDGLGGTIQVGTQSGNDTGALNQGYARFGTISAYALGAAGNGGSGGIGGLGDGAGGNGGNGVGGGATLLVRGANVSLSGAGYFDASAVGGSGGLGSTQGNGGDATVGVPADSPNGADTADGAHLLVTSRYLLDAQRGSLDAQDLTFAATATQGFGTVNGVATALGEPVELTVRNSDVSARSLQFYASGTVQPGNFAAPISVQNGTVTVASGFQFDTPGDLTVVVDSGRLTADHAEIHAGNWVSSGLTVTAPGLIEVANNLSVTSDRDIIGDVSFKAGTGTSITASGAVRLFDVSASGDLLIGAGDTISLGNLGATGLVSVVGSGDVALGAIAAGNAVTVSAGGQLAIGGTVDAVDRASLSAAGTLTGQDVHVASSGSAGSTRELAVLSDTSITLGNLDARATRLFTAGTLDLGQVNAVDGALLAGGDISLAGADATGRLLIADYAMAAAGGSPRGSTYDYDALFAASTVRATGAIGATGMIAAASLTAATAQTLSLQSLDVTGAVVLDSAGTLTLGGAVDAGAAVFTAAGGISGGDVTATSLDITSPGAIALGSVRTTGAVSLDSASTLSLVDIASGGDVTLRAVGDIAIPGGALTSPAVQAEGSFSATSSTGAIALGAVRTTGAVTLDSASTLSLVDIASGGDIILRAVGDIAIPGGALTSPAVQAAGGVSATSTAGTIGLGNVEALGGAIDLDGHGTVTTGSLAAGGALTVLSRTDRVVTEDLSGSTVTVGAAGPLLLGSVTSGGALSLTATGGVLTRGLTAGADLTIAAGGDVSTARESVLGPVPPGPGPVGGVQAGAVRAGGAIAITTTSGGIELGQVTATGGGLDLTAPGAIVAGTIATQDDIAIRAQGGSLSLSDLASSIGSIGLFATGAITAATMTADTDVTVESTAGAVQLGALTAGGAIDLRSGGSLLTADLLAQAGVSANAATTATLGAVTASTGDITLDAGGALGGLGLFAADGAITLRSGGNAGFQAVTAYGPVTANVAGNATFSSLFSQADGIQVRSLGDLTAGLVAAKTDIALVAQGGLSLGQVIGRDMALLAGGNVVASELVSGQIDPETGAIVAGQGRILVGGSATVINTVEAGAYDVAALASAPSPVRTGGTIQITQASGGRFASASAGGATLGQIDASQSIMVDSGGLALVNARWAAPSITVASTAIAINTASLDGEPLGLDAGASGTILLRSLSQNGVTLGDGFGYTEWNLSAPEWALIRSGSLTVRALDGAGAADIRIGNLAITGPQSGSTIDDPNGSVRFETVNDAGQISGGIRILGNVAARGFLATNALEFATGRFELDAATGSLAITGSGQALSGTLRITAAGIHVAEGTILDKLAQDIAYTGLVADLARPTAVQRPDGVLAAGGFDFTVGRSFYVQNTGTVDAPAGFVTAADGFRIVPLGTFPVRMIVSGSFLDGSGKILAGKDAFTAFGQNHSQIQFFGTDSQVNGCLIAATTCGKVTTPVEEPEIPVEIAGPTISNQIEILGQNDLGNTPGFTPTPDADGEQPSDEQKDAANDAAGPPIVPPTPLIDMRPLNPPGRIEEPVAGSGNPALMGSPVNENTAEGGQ